MKKILEQILVGKAAPKANSGCPPKDKKWGGAPTSRKERGWLAEDNEARQKTAIEVECELQSLKLEKAKVVSSWSCTSHKNTIMYGIVKQTGWQIAAR
jgi:hypothetical protein